MKYRLTMAALMLSLSTFVPGTWAATFNDVNSNTHYVDSIYWTVNQGITSGYDDGSGNWGPDACVRRAELLKMMVQYQLGDDFEDVADELSNDDGFSDVRPSDWFYDYVRYARDLNIVEGYQDGTFKPNDCVNRVEAMKVAVNTLMPGQEIQSSDPLQYWGSNGPLMVDMDKFAWYAPYARVLFNHGLVGTNHTVRAEVEGKFTQNYLKFFPADVMTRKEVAYMMHQIDKHLESTIPKPPTPEPKEEWYNWTEHNVSFEVPEGYYVFANPKNDVLTFSDTSYVPDVAEEGLSTLQFVKDGTLLTVAPADVALPYQDIATRGFYVASMPDGNYYYLEVEGGVLVYHKGMMGTAEETGYLRNRILSSLVVPNSELKLVSNFPQSTDYYNLGNGHANETLTLHDDILSIEVNYPGGCMPHDFELLWKGEAIYTNENNVSMVDLYLDHDSNGETCEAGTLDRFDFDISTIKDSLDGKIILRVFGGASGSESIDYLI